MGQRNGWSVTLKFTGLVGKVTLEEDGDIGLYIWDSSTGFPTNQSLHPSNAQSQSPHKTKPARSPATAISNYCELKMNHK